MALTALRNLTERLCKPFMMTMNREQTLNDFHISCHQTLAWVFECSGPLSLSHTAENVEIMRQVGYEECIYLILFGTY